MNKAAFFLLLCCLSTGMIGCMSSNTNTAGANVVTIPAPATSISGAGPSHINHRVFVSNSATGNLQIVNADTDDLSTFGIVIGGSPTFIAQTPDLTTAEIVYDSTNHTLSQIDNSTEKVTAAAGLPGASESVAVTSTGTVAFASVQTAQNQVSGNTVTGAVYEIVYTVSTSTTPATATRSLLQPVQGVRWIALDNTATNLIAFSDGAANVADSITVINAGLASPFPLIPGFDHPVTAYFTSDDTTAFVLSSGPAHGGTQPMVTKLDMTPTMTVTNGVVTPTTPIAGTPLNVAAATVGFLSSDGSTLYVAGPVCSSQPCGTPTGVLSVISTSSMTVAGSVSLGPGTPNVMTFDGTNLWIGSTGCQVSATSAQGCLSVFFPATAQVSMNAPSLSQLQNGSDDVTSLLSLVPLNGRDIMYVVEGGDLFEYGLSQTPGGTLTQVSPDLNAPQNLHIPGKAYAAAAVK